MKFSDIDFSAISNMMNNMSSEEKERLNKMADDMMKNMQDKKEEEQEEVETDLYEFLGIDEEDYQDFGPVLDQIEQAVDLEQYYEDVKEQDFSASVLFLSKAILNTLRKYHFPIYKSVLQINDFLNPSTTTIQSYLFPLMNEEIIHTLVDEGFGSTHEWVEHKLFLQQLYMLLNRAEYDFISYDDLQALKTECFTNQAFIRIKNLV